VLLQIEMFSTSLYHEKGHLTHLVWTRVRPIRVKWPMSDVPIFRRKNSDSDVRCRCL